MVSETAPKTDCVNDPNLGRLLRKLPDVDMKGATV